jgi:hypothetical protein
MHVASPDPVALQLLEGDNDNHAAPKSHFTLGALEVAGGMQLWFDALTMLTHSPILTLHSTV